MIDKKLIGSAVIVAVFLILSYLYLDRGVADFFAANDTLSPFFEFITRLGVSKWYLFGFAAMFLIFRFLFRLKTVGNRFLYLFFAVAGSGLIVDILKFIFGRSRPKLYLEQGIYGFHFFGTEHLYFSFPSGHSATAFSLAVGITTLFPRYAYIALSVAALVAFSRMAVDAHYLSDIVAGSYIGAVFAIWVKEKMIFRGISI